MSQIVLILGKSGTGKTSSLHELNKSEVNVISATGKPMPFKSDIKVYKPEDIFSVKAVIDSTKAPIVVIDDANYFLTFYKAKHLMDSNPFFAPKQVAKEFTDIMTHIIERNTDQIFYIMAHTETEENGSRVFKTTGKYIRDDLVPEGLTNIVIETIRDKGEYLFSVKPIDNESPAKTPMGMFDTETIPNSLKNLDKIIREYYK